MTMSKATQEHTTQIPWEKGGGTVGHWVKLAYIALRRELDASVRKAGITTTQWQALNVLYHKPGLTHSDLEKHLDIEAPSVTSLLNGMERKGWVKREKSPTDARVKPLHLTPRGRTLIEHLLKATAPVERCLATALSEEERDTLKRLLRAVVEALR